jgi:DNA-binding response OmpR family regulator
MSDPTPEAAPVPELRRELLALSEKHGVPSIDLATLRLRLEDLAVLPQEVARRHGVLPILVKDEALFLAMSAPADPRVVEEVEFVSGKKVFAFGCDAEQLATTLDVVYERYAQGDPHWSGARAAPAEPAAVAAPPPPAPPSERAPPPLPKPLKSRAATLLHTSPAAPPPPLPAADGGVGPRTGMRPIARIPAPPPPLPAAAMRSDPPLSPSILPSALPPMLSPSGHTVMLVVGHDGDRELLRAAFSDLGHRVIEHPRLEGALAQVDAQKPDLLVVEAQLPDGHGYSLLEALRQGASERSVSTLALLPGASSRRVVDDLRAALGVKGVLERPIRAVDVLTRAESVFEAREAPEAPEDYLSPQAEVSLQSGVEAYQRGDINAAITFVEEGLRSAPSSYRLHYHHGLLLGRRGDVHLAARALEQSLALHDHYFPALRNLAVLYERAGFRRSALEVWERAHAAAPDDATRDSIKARVVSLL